MSRRASLVLAVLVGLAARAHADPPAALRATSPAPAAAHRHTIYVEALGKGGVWGLGYDYRLTPRLALGAVASYAGLDGQRMLTFAPYVSLAPVGRRHRWFIDLGPQLVDIATPSPVPEWAGTHSTGIGAELSTGYEFRGPHLLLRVYAMGVVGASGASPWVGSTVGWAL